MTGVYRPQRLHQRRTSLIGCCRQHATASPLCKHLSSRSIVLPFSKVIFHIFQIISTYVFRRVRSYDKRCYNAAVFLDISESDFRKFRGCSLAWNFHMSCASDGRLWLVVAARPLRRSACVTVHSATLLSNFNVFQIISAVNLDESDRMMKRL